MSLTTYSRRQFLQLSGAGLALAGSAAWPALAAAPIRTSSDILPLHFNENSLGMSPRALLAAQDAIVTLGNRYPDAPVAKLRETLAAKHAVDVKQVLFGNGSTEILRAVVTYAAQLNATLLEPTPTFGAVRRYAESENMAVIQVPVGKGFVTDMGALREQAEVHKGPLLINLCNPNNPTGTLLEQKVLEAWLNAAPDNHVFLLDEAYHDYAQLNPLYQSQLGLIQQGRENLIIARTFSKIYGMAGMRIGYGVAAPKTADLIKPFAAGFNLSAAGVAAALASLNDEAFYQNSLKSNQRAKHILLDTLKELDLPFIPSNTNFVLHRINTNLADYARRMLDNQVKVGRRMTEEDGWNRISIGTPEQMQEFARTLRAFRQRNWV